MTWRIGDVSWCVVKEVARPIRIREAAVTEVT